jgi:hypothetical protein
LPTVAHHELRRLDRTQSEQVAALEKNSSDEYRDSQLDGLTVMQTLKRQGLCPHFAVCKSWPHSTDRPGQL